ncbi:hypothetical protein IQ268_09585 [Oculatella sp. LEGE 06141]|uniref:hypothetical protein n=1 Tax=Oculatella sp. LEGE 06141 TaxID=1828648 RepID=UPI001882A350|nr:hypothetical protein [Oculatella sp. LEGE 06141]MBE9178810.1 hypothetical protein [Oculatella sp. LEGE 06141]
MKRRANLGWAIALLLTSMGCTQAQPNHPPRTLQIEQTWQLQPGHSIAGHRIVSGLGDISVQVKGNRVYAPFDGTVEPHATDCVFFSSSQVPAYLIRLCGIQRSRFGDVREGEAIGNSTLLQVAVLRRQPSGQWALVEPSTSILERTLRKP